ncbi:MAG: nickel pincer cofactor biosynthesis protein LarC [Acidobacteriia bacterium]|nr:nickel pincer cofactor biosynthesis protein LarC [Terriglobia bacterium]
MTVAYFDCFAGISGDMTIGALLGAGVSFPDLRAELSKLKLKGYGLKQSRVLRNGISAFRFDVQVTGPARPASERNPVTPRRAHLKGRGLEGSPWHGHLTGEHTHRSLDEILEMIETSKLNSGAKILSQKIFRRLGEAEAKVHDVPIQQVHFHEVGAVDSIVDIVGSAVCLDWLGFKRIISSPINVGSGFIDCEHGKLPVPGPAAVELLKGIPIYSAGPEVELTTPTGAAIISTVASEYRRMKDFQSTSVGYGAGSREVEGFPNVLRVFVGEETSVPEGDDGRELEIVHVIEANIDDMNPQIYGYFVEKAMAAGALDVYITAVQMKKNRPGQCLSVICDPSKLDALTRLVFAETTTIGLRIQKAHRRVLDRSLVTLETRFGQVRVKVARLNGSVLNAMPEFADCQRLAEENAIPLKEVLAEASAKIRTLKL